MRGVEGRASMPRVKRRVCTASETRGKLWLLWRGETRGEKWVCEMSEIEKKEQKKQGDKYVCEEDYLRR